MKILVVADIHSNWPALSAIKESFDACLVLGDLVDYCTDPVPCLEWVRTHATAAIRGNHDHAVAQRIPVRKQTGLGKLAAAARPLHWDRLSGSDIKYLAQLPVTRRIELDGKRFFLVHATPRDPFDEYLKEDQAQWAARTENVDADYVCVGHSHQPFELNVGHTTIINPGSVGQPRDGDPRAAYCVIENGEVSFRRVPFDIDAVIKHMRESGLEEDVVALAEHFMKTGGRLPVVLDRELGVA